VVANERVNFLDGFYEHWRLKLWASDSQKETRGNDLPERRHRSPTARFRKRGVLGMLTDGDRTDKARRSSLRLLLMVGMPHVHAKKYRMLNY
jgi:hypothetical protein